MSISKLSDAPNHTALPLSYMVTANNGITRWEVKLSCQTSRCWGSKITEGTFSINTEVFGKQTNRLTTRLPVSMFGIRVFGAWKWGKGNFSKVYFPDQQLFCVKQKREKTIAAIKKTIYGIYKYLSEVKISYMAFQAGICSWQWWTERKQKLVEVKMQDSKLKWNQLKYSKTEKLAVSYKQSVTKKRKLSLLPKQKVSFLLWVDFKSRETSTPKKNRDLCRAQKS